ncbi:hypothetical protein FHL15_006712 [Xylaria flabelliformis]|uniref:Uncharacterized protein n=1 Tax=Xylaria flabelliformis TaxID=2512241 RepID=A0A553HWJ8_9PEZI|nr:hypothetical protein FHL15_006712 [Xylaria flabelliformis]
MHYHPNSPLFNSVMRAMPTSKSDFSTTTTTPTPTQNTSFLRRIASTPRGRASLAAVVVVGCVLDYELWTLYGTKYFGKEGQ